MKELVYMLAIRELSEKNKKAGGKKVTHKLSQRRKSWEKVEHVPFSPCGNISTTVSQTSALCLLLHCHFVNIVLTS